MFGFFFFFFFFIVPTDRIYKPLIDKTRDYLDSNLFLLKRWEIFADHSGRRFCKFDLYLFHAFQCVHVKDEARKLKVARTLHGVLE